MDKRMVISGDSHVVEPPDLFTKTLQHKYGDDVPHWLDNYKGKKGNFFYAGLNVVDYNAVIDEGGGDPETAAKLRTAGHDPAVRTKCLDEDGVYSEIINATSTLYILRARNNDLARDCCRVFNDWLADYCAYAPKRLHGTSMIHMEDVDWAVKELERVAKLGLKSVLINCDSRPEWAPYRDKKYDPFWARAQELDMPVTLHILTGNIIDLFCLYDNQLTDFSRYCIKLFDEAPLVLANEFIFGGIFDRFPKLKIVCSEFEVSWIPYWLFRMKQLEGFGPLMGIPKVKLPVDEYLRRHVYHGVVDDTYINLALGVIDPSTIMWGSDFPHVRCTYPRTQEVIERTFGRLDPEVREGIVWKNAARFYRLDTPPMLNS